MQLGRAAEQVSEGGAKFAAGQHTRRGARISRSVDLAALEQILSRLAQPADAPTEAPTGSPADRPA